MKEIDPAKTLSDILMFDGALNVKLAGRLLRLHYPTMTLMCSVEHTLKLFFNDVSKILVQVYTTSLITYLNPNLKSFTIETLVYLVEMRL